MPEEILAGESNLPCDGFILQRLSRIGSKNNSAVSSANYIHFWEYKKKPNKNPKYLAVMPLIVLW